MPFSSGGSQNVSGHECIGKDNNLITADVDGESPPPPSPGEFTLKQYSSKQEPLNRWWFKVSQRRRSWPNIKPTLVKRFVLAECQQ